MNQSSRTTIIVLRDNKESGPFTLDQLRELGLKSSDLVWVEGQSVYWLSPHEVPELREFPLDEVKAAPKIESIETLAPTADQPKKIIQEPLLKNEKQQTSPIKTPASREKWEQYLPKEAVATAVKPVAEVKDLYTKPELEKISFPSRKRMIPAIDTKILLYGGLVVAGLAIGLLLRRRSPATSQENRSLPAVTNTNKPADTVENTSTTADTVVNNTATIPPAAPLPEKEIAVAPVETKTEVKNKDTVSRAPVDSDKSEISSAEKKPKTDITKENKTSPRENLSSQVSVHTNDYTVASFGGIRNLQLTVRNESRYTLEKVAVELSYLKPRDELLKTETVYFYLVPPNGSQTVAVKKSTRGIKVTCRITKIDPRDE